MKKYYVMVDTRESQTLTAGVLISNVGLVV